MQRLIVTAVIILFFAKGDIAMGAAKNFHDFKIKSVKGQDVSFAEFKGKAVLVVNTASKCGYTSQYEGLESIYKQYQGKGLALVGFPSNDFGAQEPGSNEEIAEFCKFNYGVSFPMSEKVAVKGDKQSEVYKFLTAAPAAPGEVKWNFEKFLVSKSGIVLSRYQSSTKPNDPKLIADIESALK